MDQMIEEVAEVRERELTGIINTSSKYVIDVVNRVLRDGKEVMIPRYTFAADVASAHPRPTSSDATCIREQIAAQNLGLTFPPDLVPEIDPAEQALAEKRMGLTQPQAIVTLCGEKGRENRWIKIQQEGVDFNLVQLNLYAAATDMLAALQVIAEDPQVISTARALARAAITKATVAGR